MSVRNNSDMDLASMDIKDYHQRSVILSEEDKMVAYSWGKENSEGRGVLPPSLMGLARRVSMKVAGTRGKGACKYYINAFVGEGGSDQKYLFYLFG